METFIEEVLNNIENYYWTENNHIDVVGSKLGIDDTSNVVFKVVDNYTNVNVEITLRNGNDFKRLSTKTFSLDTKQGEEIVKVIKASRKYLIEIYDEGDSQLDDSDELTKNAEEVINKYFNS